MTVTTSIQIPSQTYGEVEEYCVNKAISISDYFLALHELSQQYQWKEKKAREARFGESHEQFSSLSDKVENDKQSANVDEKIQEITKFKKNKLKQ